MTTIYQTSTVTIIPATIAPIGRLLIQCSGEMDFLGRCKLCGQSIMSSGAHYTDASPVNRP